MQASTKVRALALTSLLICLGASSGLAALMSSVAGRHKLVYTDRAEDGASAEVAAGIAMGAFRGIFVNFLWMRANDLKEEGKFFESVDLARAITRLQPRFPRVWVFHAWNLAYNISVQTQTREERWNWVNAGIRLLRDEGIPANPNDLLLHKELAWIFTHKIGGYTDDANPYYKVRLAQEWTAVLGPPPSIPAEKRTRDGAIEVYAAWLQTIADAPGSLDEVVAKEPSVRQLFARLRAADGAVPDTVLLTRYEIWRALGRSGQKNFYLAQLPDNVKAFGAVVDDPTLQPAWNAVIPFMRRNLLQTEYRMDIDRMVRYTRKYGPIDWRHSAAHSLYWAATGVELASNRWTIDNRKEFDFVNTDRIVAQSVQELFRSGEVYFDFFAASMGQYALVQGMPSPYFVESYGLILDEIVARNWETEDRRNRGWTPLMHGYENFLRDAVCFFYRRGQRDEAERWRMKLLSDPRMNLYNNPFRTEELSLPLDEFVAKELNDRATSPSVFITQVTAALDSAFASGLLGGDQALFLSQFEYAKRFHRYFMENQRRNVIADRERARMDQWPPDFELAAGQRFVTFMLSLSLDEAEMMYDRAPESLRRYAFDALETRYKEDLTAIAAAGGRGFDALFPEPSNMNAFRAELRQRIDQLTRENAPQVEQR
jgi:hypothetical protein